MAFSDFWNSCDFCSVCDQVDIALLSVPIEWLLMDRTDLKGYFINLAHPEVNMAHIQLTEVVALYPALYYSPPTLLWSNTPSHPPPPHPGSVARSEPEQSIVPAFYLSACHNASHAPSNILAHSNWHKNVQYPITHILEFLYSGAKSGNISRPISGTKNVFLFFSSFCIFIFDVVLWEKSIFVGPVEAINFNHMSSLCLFCVQDQGQAMHGLTHDQQWQHWIESEFFAIRCHGLNITTCSMKSFLWTSTRF